MWTEVGMLQGFSVVKVLFNVAPLMLLIQHRFTSNGNLMTYRMSHLQDTEHPV